MPVYSENRAVALVSGGLDSVVSLAMAVRELDVRLVLFCNYGQRALKAERGAVLAVVNYYGLPFLELDLTWIADLAPEGMRRDETAGPGRGELNSPDQVWVPNRNGVFLNAAAAFAENYGCGVVVTGFNREEAAEFPDNSGDFVEACNRCFEFSTRLGVRVRSYTLNLTKREILRRGMELKAPLSVIWSCYRDGSRMCGECASCLRLRTAVDALPAVDRPVLEFEA